jgi:hypothetical protein
LSKSLSLSKCVFTAGYLDDVTLGDSVENLVLEIGRFQRGANEIGLTLNVTKCEIIGLGQMLRPIWTAGGFAFREPLQTDAILLGSPLFDRGVDVALVKHHETLLKIISRLRLMSAHEAFFLLKKTLWLCHGGCIFCDLPLVLVQAFLATLTWLNEMLSPL